MNESVNKFVRARLEIENEIGRTPTNDEISRRMGMPVKEVRKLRIRAAGNGY